MAIFPWYFPAVLSGKLREMEIKCDLTTAWEQKFRKTRSSGNDFCDNTAGTPVNFVFWLVRQLVGSFLGNRQQHPIFRNI